MNGHARSLAFGLALSLSVLAQQPKPLPPDHPAVATPGRLDNLSRLTEAVAGSRPAAASPVPRKNLIDERLFSRMQRDAVPHAPLASDEEFFRRVHLDLIGRIPDAAELEKFLAYAEPDKRDQLIDRLVGSHSWLANWSHWFLDLSRSVGGIVGAQGRNLYYDYIYDNLQADRPYNELVGEILTARAHSNWYSAPSTYLIRSRILGVVNTDVMHEDSADEMTVNVFKQFLGVNLQCISCHDGRNHLEKMNQYLTGKTRKEFWSQAAFFGNTRIFRRTNVNPGRDEYGIADDASGYDTSRSSLVRIQRTGKGPAEPSFILTGERPAPGKPLREELARMLTSHPQFARATVNTFWAELMGAGLVDPVSDFDLDRLDRHPQLDLLNALAEDFRKSNYSLPHLFRTITKSSAYQLSSVFPGQWQSKYSPYFARKFVRRLTAEQIYDSISVATGRAREIPIKESHRRVRYLNEIRDPEDISTNPGLKDVHYFVDTFGQANRRSTDRSTDLSITQAVLLLNGSFIRDRVKVEPDTYLGKLLDREKWSDEQIIDNLFPRFLLRQPTAEE
ncbi:MAG: DUF1553 domain-containing protein, partial [Bryobacteraceae bacterium]